MSEGVDLIDIYADEEFNQDPEFSNADQIDLYDDVLAASSQPSDDRSSSAEPPPPIRQEQSPKPNSKSPAILYTYSGLRNKRAAVYVGSFSWWTTDQQLIQIIRSVGVYDVVELKFAENRANGQSKGYAEVVVASENSVHKLLELLPGKILNGEKVDVRLATRQNLSQFEAQARKRECVRVPRGGVPPRAHSRDSSDSADGRATPTENLVPPPPRVDKPPSVLPYFSRPPSALPLMGLPPPPIPPPPPLSSGFGVPPPPPGIHYQHLMPPPPRLPPHLAVPPPGAIPPALHLNPAFFPPPNAAVGPPPDAYIKASAPYNHHGRSKCHGRSGMVLSPCSRELGPPPPTVCETEFEEIMNRNRAISSSAISKAVSGASAGDYSDAIETLLTAIAVIKQSRVANDERCRVLISSLKDCLHGIEAKSYSVGASGSSSRKRHRSRERSPSRSRESSRRHRDLLHNEDRHEDYFQERNREHERHRDRERDRHH
ncbi:cleavage and polyadenylation specificity factor subunit 7 isoform X1 [Dromiciops gliroides]|uniref:cleavage and polyadenylation specificity factor subunit 7 isoform X1 n=1 Tax=Dromiciops gliroides TaxID=33562 RepID=UPI001CC478A6|nr:cleavage and polyadenylation specificity factor subunit 7 isoform X1 [Dromiciops gliroides]XP_043827393.1 cleavage and polyadenylation specificity factor subunit 7 isoform X1 [Dromiciops gliroides]XP_043827394.1 cleavage and polyadenylation specificity factor subunit 7 isoform X1 [Dromiciops gliroides]XP_043827395.1 cleavage and polyadenylation specificity factor subunit 7 isoform X1 [Dromiciops gliroides]